MNNGVRVRRGGADRRMAVLLTAAAGAALLGVTGCGADGPAARPLTADAFVRNRPSAFVANPVDKPGPLLYDTVRVPLLPGEEHPDQPVRDIGSLVQEAVKTPSAQATQPAPRAALAPTTLPALVDLPPAPGVNAPRPTTGPDLSGQYLNVGAVLMEVNGQAIFTDKVLNDLERPLSAEAKKRNLTEFRQIAQALLENQIQLYKRDELEFASAKIQLGPQDEALANAVTIQWRQQQITTAGGSLELAKRRAANEGQDFEELVKRQYRLHMIQIYYQKHVIPLIQVAAADIRTYYNQHKDTEFTTHGAARFRVIKISPAGLPGMREEAYAQAEKARKRAIDGDDFATLAKEYSTDTNLKLTGGYIVPGGWVDEGAYAVTEVNKALDKMHPGDISDVITDARGNVYVVKLEDLRRGGVQSFEDMAVQDKIRERLRAQQFQALREKHVADLERNAVTRRNDAMIKDALDMIIRRYSQWASAR